MGFPIGYTEVLLPTLLLHTLTLLGLLRAFILSLLHSLGLSTFLHPDHHHHHHHHRPLPSLPALLIRDRLPVMLFSDALLKESPSAAAADRCAVCLREFEGGEEVTWPLNCRHIFHRSCLDRWIDHDQRTCPLCRAHLLSTDLIHDFHRRLVFADHHSYNDEFSHDYDHDHY